MSPDLTKIAHLVLTADNDLKEAEEAERALDAAREAGARPHPLAVGRFAKAREALAETWQELTEAATPDVLIAAVERILALEAQLERAEAVGRQKGILEIAQEYRQEAERLRVGAKAIPDLNRAETWKYKAEKWDREAEKLEKRAASREDA